MDDRTKWMDESMNESMNEWMDDQTNDWMNEWIIKSIDQSFTLINGWVTDYMNK